MKSGITTKFDSNIAAVMKEIDKADKKRRAKVMVILKRKLRAAAPKDSGNLRRSLNHKHWKRTTGVGFTRQYGAHAWLVENGHEEVLWGRSTGRRVKGYPFFAKTWNAAIPEIKKIMSEQML